MYLRTASTTVRLLALMTIVLAACTPATPPTAGTTAGSAPAPTQPPAEIKLRYGTQISYDSLDGHVVLGAGNTVGLFEGLLDLSEDGSKVIGALASEWKNVNPTTWQFKLTPGRKWSDGAAVTAEDVKFSIDRAANPANKLGILSRMGPITGAEAVDPQTVNVITRGPDPLLLKRLAVIWIYPKAYFEKVGEQEFGRKPVGSGMFILKEFVPNQRTVVVPNPLHPVKPTVSEITFLSIAEPVARVNGLRSGELDIVEQLPYDQADRLKSAGFSIIAARPDTPEGGALFADRADGLLRDKRVRQALNYAIDKETLAKTVFYGYATAQPGQTVQSHVFGYNPDVKPYPYDPAKAKQLLAEAGYASGLKIAIDMGPQVPQAEQTWLYVQSQLKEVGVQLDINKMPDRAAWLDRFYNRAPRSNIVNVTVSSAPYNDSDFSLTWFRSTQPDPFPYYKNPAFDEPYLASQTELDEAKRLKLIQRAIQVMHDDPPYIFLVHTSYLWAAAGNLTDVRYNANSQKGALRFELIKKK